MNVAERKEAIDNTFHYLSNTITPDHQELIRVKLLTVVIKSIIQVIDPMTFEGIYDLVKVYVCNADCTLFFTDYQFRRAWSVVNHYGGQTRQQKFDVLCRLADN